MKSGTESNHHPASLRVILVCFFLTVATLWVYWPVRHFEFTNWDDPAYVYGNSLVNHGLNSHSILWALGTSYYDFWHPLTWMSHMLDCSLFGLNAGWHHLSSLAFHIADTLLLFTLLRRMTGAWKRSAVVAALFALHPLHVESVAWISERKDVLSTFFFLLSLWAYVRYAEMKRRMAESAPEPTAANTDGKKNSAPKPNPAGFYMGLTVLMFAFGLMSKAMIVTLPAVCLLLDFWPLRRVTIGTLKTEWFGLIREKIPLFILSAFSSKLTFANMQAQNNILSGTTHSWSFSFCNAMVSYIRYIGKTFWPTDLIIAYPMPDLWEFWQIAGSVLLLLVISLAALRYARTIPYLGFGWFMFLVTLLPVIGVVSMSNQAIADRYTYIPSIGFFVVLVWGGADVALRLKLPGIIPQGIAAAVLLACGMVARGQVAYWRNSSVLWEHCTKISPTDSYALYGLGWTLQAEGKIEEAMEKYRAALDSKPNHLNATLNLGVCYAMQTNYQEATNWFAKAIRLKPDYSKARSGMGLALFELGDMQGALDQSTEAVRLDPQNLVLHITRGRALGALGRGDEAREVFHQILQGNPAQVDARYYLGVEMLNESDFTSAAKTFLDVISIAPKRTDARCQYAVALTHLGQKDKAAESYREALELDPRCSAALNGLEQLGK
jgi:Tfp pilus assembly protein PilF